MEWFTPEIADQTVQQAAQLAQNVEIHVDPEINLGFNPDIEPPKLVLFGGRGGGNASTAASTTVASATASETHRRYSRR